MFYLYYLLEPTGGIRYVGYTADPAERLASHCSEKARTHKVYWIQSLLRAGLCPTMKIICVVYEIEEAKRIEIALIARLRCLGVPLVNGTAGGDGAAGLVHSEEARKKMSASHKGRKFTEEHKKKLGDSKRGKTREVTPKMRAASERMLGQKTTDEVRKKISTILRERAKAHGPRSAEVRRRISEAQKGILRGPASEETRQKLREIWARRRIS